MLFVFGDGLLEVFFHLEQWFPNFFSSRPLGSWSTLTVAPPALNKLNELENRKNHKNLVISTMNVQANLSILICYILMGKKFQKSLFQYQSLINIFFQYAPMAPSLGTTDLEHALGVILK